MLRNGAMDCFLDPNP
ncbi:MAG: hypothetical protein EZS28_049096, partial [Streblomastix strix]